MHRHRIIALLSSLLILAFALALLFSSCHEKKYRIAVSQCYHNAWNAQVGTDLKREASLHPDIDLTLYWSDDGAEGQVRDVRQFIRDRVDLILLSPDDRETLSPVVDEAAAAGIPIILIDSETSSQRYTARVGVDNFDIGLRGGQFVLYSLKGASGKILAVRGPEGSTPARERAAGFRTAISRYPDVLIVDSCYTDWTYECGYPLIDSLLTLHPDVDIITAQCDPLALAAYDVCQKRRPGNMPIITGIDALNVEGGGIQNVQDNKIAASLTNPTGAMECIDLALDILEGRPFERETILSSQLVDRNNVRIFSTQAERVDKLTQRLDDINARLGSYEFRFSLLRAFVIVIILLLVLSISFIVYITRSIRQRTLLRQKVEEATRAKLTFFTNVSHSFRTPLTLIADPIRTLRAEGGLSKRQDELLGLIASQTDKLTALADKVLGVLQDDLLKDGRELDAIALSTETATAPTLTEMRQRQAVVTHPDLVADQNRRTVLIIDDNADIRKYLSLLLKQHQYLVLTAPNGEEGLLVARQNIPDLVICDVMMPVMDGLECCRLLKSDQNTSHIPVLMLTAYALDDQRIQGYQSGADAYITKPFNGDVLLARIANLIDSRKVIDTSKDHYDELQRAEFGNLDSQLVKHFHSYVTEHMGNSDLDIPQLCEEFAMSRVQLYRKCKSLTGQSPVELIRIIRLKAAQELVLRTGQSISEIAYTVGFTSPSYFAKCYREQFGISPTDARLNR